MCPLSGMKLCCRGTVTVQAQMEDCPSHQVIFAVLIRKEWCQCYIPMLLTPIFYGYAISRMMSLSAGALFYSPFCHRAPMEHKNKLSNMTLLINQAPFQAPIQSLGPPLCTHIWILMCVWGSALINTLKLLPSHHFICVPCISCNVNFLYVN